MQARKNFLTVRVSTAAVTAVAFALAIAGPVQAGQYGPYLALGSLSVAGVDGRYKATLTGTWQFDDLVEIDFPAALVVSQGSRFVAYRLGGEALGGDAGLLADGLSGDEIEALESVAVEPVADARVLSVGPHRLDVALPTFVEPGRVAAQLYVVLQHELPDDHQRHYVSNRLEAEVAGGGAR